MGTAKKKVKKRKPLIEIGWREYVVLPEITKMPIKVKVDTGARTSALHATELKIFRRKETRFAEFKVHPNQDSARPAIKARHRVLEFRNVKSSNGETQRRPVIQLEIKMGDETFTTEVTLVNRDLMGFRMLLGRKALKGRFLVNVAKSYMTNKDKRKPNQ